MKKYLAFVFVLFLLSSTAFAQTISCTDITVNLVKGSQSAQVYKLQNFLYAKGYLKAKPNGYFGVGTFNALKAYQKNNGLLSVGSAGSVTRALIKKQSCGTGDTSTRSVTSTSPQVAPQTQSAQTPVKTTQAVAPVVVPTAPQSPQATRNAQRRADVINILKSLYAYYADSRGVNAITVFDTPKELCTKPKITQMASSAEALVLATPDSPCKDYIDVSYLEPTYISHVPRDPSITTSSYTTGYTITRSQYNDIEITAKNSEDKAIIKVRCNFNGYCNEIKQISTIEYKQPTITSLNRSIFLRDGIPTKSFMINGTNFTATNTIKLFSQYTSKEYILGSYPAVATTSATTSAISIDPSPFVKNISCGYGCSDLLPFGQYTLTVTNEGGVTNGTGINLKGSTVSTLATHSDSSVVPPAKDVKVATISISSTIPLTLKSYSFKSTSTSSGLPAKITKFILKDPSTGTTYTGALTGVQLAENASKVYDVYVDVDEVYIQDAGSMTYGGTFLVNDPFSGYDMTLKIPEFSFTVSH